MSEKIAIALIAGLSALGGGVIGGCISIWTAKYSADREDKRRLKEIEREAARKRIDTLYEPLLNAITPAPPYDEFYIDHDTQKWVITIFEKNERYASPHLLDLFWGLRSAYFNDGNFDNDMQWDFLRCVSSEYSELKKMIGYGRILKKDSIIKIVYKKIKSKVEPIYTKRRLNILIRKYRRRQKRS